MSIDYGGIVASLQQYNPSIAGVIVTGMTGGIKFVTNGWNPDPNEVKRVINAWRGGASISVTLAGVKFSVLQSTPERFISTNIKKQGHLVGASTPQGECVLGFINPDGAYDGAYADIARAAGQMRPGGSASGLGVTAATSQMAYEKTDVSQAQLQQGAGGGGAGAGGQDAQDVQQLIQWIQNPDNNLAQYIQYCLQNYDQARIAAFARFYRSLRQILG